MEESVYAEYADLQDVHWWFIGRRAILDAVLRRRLGSGRDESLRILDVGCGTGPNLEALDRFGAVIGADVEPVAARVAQSRGWDVEVVSGSALPFEDGEFGVVTLLDVAEHVASDVGLFEELKRVMAPGGLCLVTVPAYQWMWGSQDVAARHVRRYTRPRLVATLEQAGFTVRTASYFNTLLFLPIAAVRVLRRAFRVESSESDFGLTPMGPINRLLAWTFSLEARILPRTSLPFGVSIMALAEGDESNRSGVGPREEMGAGSRSWI